MYNQSDAIRMYFLCLFPHAAEDQHCKVFQEFIQNPLVTMEIITFLSLVSNEYHCFCQNKYDVDYKYSE